MKKMLARIGNVRIKVLILFLPFMFFAMLVFFSAMAFRWTGRQMGDDFDERFPYVRDLLRLKHI